MIGYWINKNIKIGKKIICNITGNKKYKENNSKLKSNFCKK